MVKEKITKEQILKDIKKYFQETRKQLLIEFWLMRFYDQMEDRLLLASYAGMFEKDYKEMEIV